MKLKNTISIYLFIFVHWRFWYAVIANIICPGNVKASLVLICRKGIKIK